MPQPMNKRPLIKDSWHPLHAKLASPVTDRLPPDAALRLALAMRACLPLHFHDLQLLSSILYTRIQHKGQSESCWMRKPCS